MKKKEKEKCSSTFSSNVDFAFAIGDKLYAENLWLIIEIESDDRGLRFNSLVVISSIN